MKFFLKKYQKKWSKNLQNKKLCVPLQCSHKDVTNVTKFEPSNNNH